MSLQKREKLLEKETGNPGGKGALGYDWSILTMEGRGGALLGKTDPQLTHIWVSGVCLRTRAQVKVLDF